MESNSSPADRSIALPMRNTRRKSGTNRVPSCGMLCQGMLFQEGFSKVFDFFHVPSKFPVGFLEWEGIIFFPGDEDGDALIRFPRPGRGFRGAKACLGMGEAFLRGTATSKLVGPLILRKVSFWGTPKLLFPQQSQKQG